LSSSFEPDVVLITMLCVCHTTSSQSCYVCMSFVRQSHHNG